MIVDGLRISAMNAAVQSLQGVLNEWLQGGSIPEAAWGKTRRLEFQDLLRRRDELIRRLDKFACTSCPNFEEHVSGTVQHYPIEMTHRLTVPIVPGHAQQEITSGQHRQPQARDIGRKSRTHPGLRATHRRSEGAQIH